MAGQRYRHAVTSLRRLDRDDYLDTLRLGAEAFGRAPAPEAKPREVPAVWPPPGLHSWGSFRDDRLVARMATRQDACWWDGVEVPTAGVCGVTVRAEERGEGLLSGLFDAMLREARERGEVVSTLYPTAPGIYRRLGYELVATLRRVELPTAQLAGVRRAEGVHLRRAGERDIPAIRAAYTAWAREQNGPLTRTSALFDPADTFDGCTAGTLAEDAAGQVRGFALWSRGQGYGDGSTLEVHDLIALDTEAGRALWRMVGSFASVTGQVQVTTSGDDVSRLSLPSLAWREVKSNPYMLRVLDVAGAFGLRSAPAGLGADLPFRVSGDALGLIDGDYRLRVGSGEVSCTPTESAERTYTPQGIALAWAGAQSSADIRRAGHLTGPAEDDRTWDALFTSAQVHIRDYF